MTIEKVSGNMNVSFGKGAIAQPIKSKKTPEQIKEGKKKLALALGALAVAGAVTTGVVIGIKKGAFDTLKRQTKLSIEEFKKVGNFDKGKALIGDKGYTGEIFTKDGTKILYENGLLKSAQNNSRNFTKTYNYLKNGDKVIHTTSGIFNKRTTRLIAADKSVIIGNDLINFDEILSTGKSGIVTETKFKPIIKDGKKSVQKIESVFAKNSNFKNGQLVNYKRITDLSTGKVSLERINPPAQESLIKVPVKFADGRKGKALYRGKELVSQRISTYDPATKTVITEHLDPNNPNLRSLYIFDKYNKDLPAVINIDKTAGKAYATKCGSSQIQISNEGDLKDLAEWSKDWIDALKNFMKKYN